MTTRRISARTALCGVVLHPATHTRSPAMHNAAFEALGIDAIYTAFDVPPEKLPAAVAGAKALGLRQLAVSIPHKVAVMDHLDALDETARAIGAVNTVTLRDGRLEGANTDWIGAVAALERARPVGKGRAVVLGAGGAARAVAFGLKQRGAEVWVLNRTLSKAEELCRSLALAGAGTLDRLAELDHEILVNTTSVGLREDRSPVRAADLRGDAVVLDAVYEPERTRLLQDAEARGARTVEGKWMLVHQAAEQLRLWTGKEAPVEVMARAFDDAGP